MFEGGAEVGGVFRFCPEEELSDPEDPEAGSESESSERDHEIPKKKRKMTGKPLKNVSHDLEILINGLTIGLAPYWIKSAFDWGIISRINGFGLIELTWNRFD